MEAKEKKPANDIRVKFQTRVGNVISYAEKLLKENNFKTLNFSAVGGSIGTLVNAVEILKYTNKGLYQVNRMATISYQSIEEGGEVQGQRLYPKLEVILSFEKPTNLGEGFQECLTEEERKKFNEIREKNKNDRRGRGFRGRRRGMRRGFRGRGMRRGFRGRGRGGRPLMRRGRGMMRGGRPPIRRGRGMTRGAAPRGRGKN